MEAHAGAEMAAASVAAEMTMKDYQAPRSPSPRTRETEEAVSKAVCEHVVQIGHILAGVLGDVPTGFWQRLCRHTIASGYMVKTYVLAHPDEAERFISEARTDPHVRLAVFRGAVCNFGDEKGCHGDVLAFLEQVADPTAVALSSPGAALISKRGGELKSRTLKQLRTQVQDGGGVFVYGAPIALAPAKSKGVDGLGQNGLNCKPAVYAALSASSEGVATVVAVTDISSTTSREHIFPDSGGATQLSLYGNDGGGYTSFHMDTTKTNRDGQNVGLPGQLRSAGIRPMITRRDGSTVDGLDSFNYIIGNGQPVGNAC